MRCHATMTLRRGAAATAFAPTAWTTVEANLGNRQTAFQSATTALPGRATNDTHSIDETASGTAAAMRKHASGSAKSWNKMLRKIIELNTAKGAAFFALRTHGKFSPTTKRVCGITDASMSVGCGVGGGAAFFLKRRRVGMDGIFVGSREGANEGPASTETCKAPGVVEDGSNDVIEKDVVGSTVTEERNRLWPNSTNDVGAWANPNA
mmetsp:Transcript_13197/g.35017  ORF Transcript_13197/g.35017 Transcript_13197/m.35017 type:complete len:208 (-) Transcript_13197:1102-1725(-)